MVRLQEGERFGRLVLIERLPGHRAVPGRKAKPTRWLCRCDCGAEALVHVGALRTGNTRSCGCLRDEGNHATHRMTRTPVYQVWKSMRQRCQNPRAKAWRYYGGRGIRVSKRWDSFEAFLADMGEPKPGQWIERRDNDGPYAPGNCYWAWPLAQARNRSNGRLIAYRNRTWTAAAWAEHTGLPYKTILQRLGRGWSVGQALGFAQPPKGDGHRPERAGRRYPARVVTYRGKTLPATEWTKITGIASDTIRGRLDAGWSPGAALGFSRRRRGPAP